MVMVGLLIFSFLLIYLLSDEYCDKQVEKIIRERIEDER